MATRTYTKEFESDPENLPDIEQFVLDIADTLTMTSEKYNSLELSVAEAASNSIVHGNKSDINKLVKISVFIDKNKMKIIFKDEGNGFNPNEIPDPTTPENILRDHGRGIHIMKSYLSELKYNFTPSGTEAILLIDLD